MAHTKDNLKSLKDIFRDDIQFVVPDYQRGYSWGDEQLDALWEDLENITDDRTHYTGMFTFCVDKNDDRLYQIVDGQQRMTTLIILINELLTRIEGGIPNGSAVEDYIKKYLYKQKSWNAPYLVYHFQYNVDSSSNAFFISHILEQEESESYLFSQHTLYTKNLLNAKRYFAKKLENFTQEKLAELFIKVTEKLRFNEYLIEDLDDVYVTFETMNNRGKSLSSLELLKNRLIYLSTLFANKHAGDPDLMSYVEELRRNINNTWKTIYEYLGKSTKRVLGDDTFLRDHWIMYFRYDRSVSLVFRRDLLSKEFTAKRVLDGDLSINDVFNYVSNLQKCVVYWFNINCPQESTLSQESKEWLSRLNRVGIGAFRPLLMAAYLKGDRSKNYDDVLPLVKACEKFRFLVISLTSRRSNTSDSEFYGLAHKYFTGQYDRDVVERVNELTDYWTSTSNFVNECIERYKKKEGFYSWTGLRYFLYEYEKSLQSTNEEKVSWDLFERNQDGKISIEHIYPQSPTEEYWTSRFTTDADRALTHSLGNLLLLSKSKNSELQNGSFDKKKLTVRDENHVISHNGYDNGSYSELEVARSEEWTPDAIVERGTNMLKFLQQHWGLDEFSEEEINKVLNIADSIPPSSSVSTSSPDLAYEDVDEEMMEQEDLE